MVETSARLLRLLSLLQARPEWTSAELAERLEVARRTVRRDVERLRDLGYPVESTPGVTGGYRLGQDGRMPPLLLDDDEAVAVTIGLRTAAGGSVSGLGEASARALTKLEQVLPAHLRHRVGTLQSTTATVQEETPTVSPDTLTTVADTCRACERLRFDYTGHDGTESLRLVEPHRLVVWGQRWYLLAWDVGRGDWRTFRVDRLRPRLPTGPRFPPREPPEGDAAGYLYRSIGSTMWPIQARLRVHAPAETVADRILGIAEPIDERTCLLRLGGDSPAMLAVWIGVLDADFEVLHPPELADHIRALADRYHRAVG